LILVIPLAVVFGLVVRYVLRRARAEREEADRLAAAFTRASKGKDP